MEEGPHLPEAAAGGGEDVRNAITEFSHVGEICLCNFELIMLYHDPAEGTLRCSAKAESSLGSPKAGAQGCALGRGLSLVPHLGKD